MRLPVFDFRTINNRVLKFLAIFIGMLPKLVHHQGLLFGCLVFLVLTLLVGRLLLTLVTRFSLPSLPDEVLQLIGDGLELAVLSDQALVLILECLNLPSCPRVLSI